MLADVYRADTAFGRLHVDAILLQAGGSGWGLNDGLSYLYKTGAVVGFDPEDFEGLFVFGELLEIFLCQGMLDVVFIGWIYQCDAGALEACS